MIRLIIDDSGDAVLLFFTVVAWVSLFILVYGLGVQVGYDKAEDKYLKWIDKKLGINRTDDDELEW